MTSRERRALRISAGTLLLIVAAVGLALMAGALISEHLTPEAWRIRADMAETREKLEEARAEAEQARLEERERDELIRRLFDELEAIRREIERVHAAVAEAAVRDPPAHHHEGTASQASGQTSTQNDDPKPDPPAHHHKDTAEPPGRSGTATGGSSTATAQQHDPRPGNTPDHARRKPDAGPPDHARRKGKP